MKLQLMGMCLLFIALSLFSCRNKDQERLLAESAEKLEKLNTIGLYANMSSEAALNKLVFEDYASMNCAYLQLPVTTFSESAARFSGTLSNALKQIRKYDEDTLFSHYQQLQQAYRLLRQKVLDSFSYAVFDSSFHKFINLDKDAFAKKYLGSGDSTSVRLRLLFLQADVVSTRVSFLNCMLETLTPFCGFSPLTAIALPDKQVYKQGEKLTVNAALVDYHRVRNGYLLINGKQVNAVAGAFRYSKRITEKPGVHDLRFDVVVEKSGRKETYPVRINYLVQ